MNSDSAPASITDTRPWTGTAEPDLTEWLGDAPHSWDDSQLILHTQDGDVRPRTGSTLVQWDDGTVTSASPRTAQRVYGPDGIAGRLTTGHIVAHRWHRAALDRGWTEAAHVLGCVLAALDGETDPHQLGLDEPEEAADKPEHAPHEQYRYATTWREYHAGRRAALDEPKEH